MKTRVRLIKNGSRDTGAVIGDTGFIEQIITGQMTGAPVAIVCLDKNRKFVELRIDKLENLVEDQNKASFR